MNFRSAIFVSTSLLGIFVSTTMVQAQQVTPDGSLNTIVNSSNGRDFIITGGGNAGTNLFHSFSQFSVPTGGSAIFNNATNIQNIFSRVTGGTASNIDGVIQANGSANLFLLNPSGLLFGPNAQLNIGGSFLGTTASSIQFADGVEFSAVNPSPLLTMSVPIGLQMGQNPGAILVQGSGHRLTGSNATPSDRSRNPIGLRVNAGRTMALLGGAVDLMGGIVTTQGGHLEVGAVQSGTVQLNATGQGWVSDYSAVSQFHDLHLAGQSLLDASGTAGSIALYGSNISLSEGSVVLLANLNSQSNLSSQSSGGITVHATETLNLTGTTPDRKLGSLIQLDNLGQGAIGDLNVTTTQLSLYNGGRLAARTFAAAPGGNLIVNVADTIVIDGVAPANPSFMSAILTRAASSGNAGDVTISTGNLKILNSANLISSNRGTGTAGKIRVTATDLIEIVGNDPITLSASTLNAVSVGAGNAQPLWVQTARLILRDGGALGSNALASGAASSVTVNATKSVEVSGSAPISNLPSRITSTAEILSAATQNILGFPAIPSGNAGALIINTPSLRISNGGLVSVRNDGPGSAGDLQINAKTAVLDNQSRITAATASGNGGDIHLNLQENLLLRHNSLITATTSGNGNGGNLMIHTPTLVGWENSDITANAVQGRGGNIDITTQGILGLKYRDRLTPENDITASSEFGVNGMVQVNTIGVDPNSGLTTLSVSLVDPSQKVVAGCADNQNSSFVATGRGGVPADPTRIVNADRTWSDFRPVDVSNAVTSVPKEIAIAPLVEASTWQLNAQGQPQLIATGPNSSSHLTDSTVTCAK
jgi:filamentous hemagglutinin family protein